MSDGIMVGVLVDAHWRSLIASAWVGEMGLFESPIEQYLFQGLLCDLLTRPASRVALVARGENVEVTAGAGESWTLQPQAPIERYRVDLLVLYESGGSSRRFAVEADGRDFHSSSEAVLRDRARDLRLRQLGITTLRLSGSRLNSERDRWTEECIARMSGLPWPPNDGSEDEGAEGFGS